MALISSRCSGAPNWRVKLKPSDYVIDLDNIWEWLGFKQKVNAKKTLEKHFKLDIDYKLLLPQQKQNKNGGNNKETFMLTVKTFKSLCLKAATSKAGQIHEYYINLEETLHEIIDEQTDELKKQLENKTEQLENKTEQLDACLTNSELEKDLLREQTILQQFPENKQCVYFATIDNKNYKGETLVKFGCSNFLQQRVGQHKVKFDNFRLVNAFEVHNSQQVENAIKSHPKLKNSKSHLLLDSKNYTEMFVIDDELTVDIIDKTIKNIVKGYKQTPENYSRIFDENSRLIDENHRLLDEINSLKLIKVFSPDAIRDKSRSDLPLHLESKTSGSPSPFGFYSGAAAITGAPIGRVELKDKVEIKKIKRTRERKCIIDNIEYKSLYGTREEVWNQSAYKTVGSLIKENFVLGKNDKIISKLRQEQGKKNVLELTKLFRSK
jgi:phage anti-repressor protein